MVLRAFARAWWPGSAEVEVFGVSSEAALQAIVVAWRPVAHAKVRKKLAAEVGFILPSCTREGDS
jgi:hypothetical protein